MPVMQLLADSLPLFSTYPDTFTDPGSVYVALDFYSYRNLVAFFLFIQEFTQDSTAVVKHVMTNTLVF